MCSDRAVEIPILENCNLGVEFRLALDSQTCPVSSFQPIQTQDESSHPHICSNILILCHRVLDSCNVLCHTPSGSPIPYSCSKWVHISILPLRRRGSQRRNFPLSISLFVLSRETLFRIHYTFEWGLSQRNSTITT